MKEVKIIYDFKKLKGKPKRLLESLDYKIKSYGVQSDTVTLIFLCDENDLKIIKLLSKLELIIKF